LTQIIVTWNTYLALKSQNSSRELKSGWKYFEPRMFIGCILDKIQDMIKTANDLDQNKPIMLYTHKHVIYDAIVKIEYLYYYKSYYF